MKTRFLLAASSVIALTGICDAAYAEKYELRKEPSSSACHVQGETSLPKLGDLLKLHATRKEACKDAAARYDKESTDSSKCWTYGKGTIDSCKVDGVTLPPK